MKTRKVGATRRVTSKLAMRQPQSYQATFLKRSKWWVAWSDDVPGALTQGKTLLEARENLRDAIRLMLEPVDLVGMPAAKLVRDRVTL